MQELIKRAKELLADGTVARVLGWKAGDMPWNPEPAYFETEESLKEFVYDGFCGANLSKYMIEASKKEGKTLVFLKPCDTYSFNQLIKEHRVDREKAYIIGVGCKGTLKPEKIREAGIKGIERVAVEGDTLKFETIYGEKELPFADALLERCKVCKGKKHMVYDELIGAAEDEEAGPVGNRFEEVEKLEAMTCVCSVGLDMIAVPGDIEASTISAIIADEMAIGMINQKTTAVRLIPVIGKTVGDQAEFGGLLGYAPIMPVNRFACDKFVNRGGRIPAPIHSFKN